MGRDRVMKKILLLIFCLTLSLFAFACENSKSLDNSNSHSSVISESSSAQSVTSSSSENESSSDHSNSVVSKPSSSISSSVEQSSSTVSSSVEQSSSTVSSSSSNPHTANDHIYTWRVIQGATCTQPLIEEGKCSCGDITTKTGNTLNHDIEYHEKKSPTCTEKGWDAYETCKNCSYSTKLEKNALDHFFGSAWQNNQSQHWHECLYGCNQKNDIADHNYNSHSLNGTTLTATCTVCNYETQVDALDGVKDSFYGNASDLVVLDGDRSYTIYAYKNNIGVFIYSQGTFNTCVANGQNWYENTNFEFKLNGGNQSYVSVNNLSSGVSKFKYTTSNVNGKYLHTVEIFVDKALINGWSDTADVQLNYAWKTPSENAYIMSDLLDFMYYDWNADWHSYQRLGGLETTYTLNLVNNLFISNSGLKFSNLTEIDGVVSQNEYPTTKVTDGNNNISVNLQGKVSDGDLYLAFTITHNSWSAYNNGVNSWNYNDYIEFYANNQKFVILFFNGQLILPSQITQGKAVTTQSSGKLVTVVELYIAGDSMAYKLKVGLNSEGSSSFGWVGLAWDQSFVTVTEKGIYLNSAIDLNNGIVLDGTFDESIWSTAVKTNSAETIINGAKVVIFGTKTTQGIYLGVTINHKLAPNTSTNGSQEWYTYLNVEFRLNGSQTQILQTVQNKSCDMPFFAYSKTTTNSDSSYTSKFEIFVPNAIVGVTASQTQMDVAFGGWYESDFAYLFGVNDWSSTYVLSVDGFKAKNAGNPISWTINGIAISKYALVYNNTEHKQYLDAISAVIKTKTGITLPVLKDSASNEKYEILFGDTSKIESSLVATPKALNYVIAVKNDKLVIKTGGKHSFIKFANEFASLVLNKSNVKMSGVYLLNGDFYDDPYDTSIANGTDVRFMSVNTQAELKNYNNIITEAGFEFERRVEIFYAMLDYYSPDVIGLQEFCASWEREVKKYYDFSKWQLLEFKNPILTTENVLTTIMFRKDKYSVVESGMQWYKSYANNRCRCITWAILKDNVTKKEFCFVSTHWDGTAEVEIGWEQVAELVDFVNEKAKKYPVITTGDFNRNEWTDEIKTLLAQTNSLDSKYAAKTRLNNIGSWHEWGLDTPSSGSGDHITVTAADTVVLKFETMMYNEQIWVSDHAWVFADAQFVQNKAIGVTYQSSNVVNSSSVQPGIIWDTSNKTTEYSHVSQTSLPSGGVWISGKLSNKAIITQINYYVPSSDYIIRARASYYQASVDGVTWVTIATLPDTNDAFVKGGVITLTVNNSTAFNYVRMVQDENKYSWYWSIGTSEIVGHAV